MEQTIETVFIDQSRWNSYGERALGDIRSAPERFIVDPTNLSASKSALIEAMSGVADKRILEFGAGRGEFSVALAQLGATVTGIDIGSDLIALARQVAAVNKVQCDFVVGSISDLPFESGLFDCVVGNAILHHLPKQGVVDSLKEAWRVLKPGGMALFFETVENSRLFDFIQNAIPIGKPTSPRYRPSILQRRKWKAYQAQADDRALSNAELTDAKGCFRDVAFKHSGLLIRLKRLWPSPKLQRLLSRIDSFLTHERSPLKRLSQAVLVVYRK